MPLSNSRGSALPLKSLTRGRPEKDDESDRFGWPIGAGLLEEPIEDLLSHLDPTREPPDA
jgi:hypothetical protein